MTQLNTHTLLLRRENVTCHSITYIFYVRHFVEHATRATRPRNLQHAIYTHHATRTTHHVPRTTHHAPRTRYKLVQCDDNPRQNMEQHFASCTAFIHDARVRGGTVLVHCIAGISRASAITLAYLLSITRLELPVLVAGLKHARSVANPNQGFLQQLEEFAGSKERRAAAALPLPPLGYLDHRTLTVAACGGDNSPRRGGAGAGAGGGGGASAVDESNADEAYILKLASGTNHHYDSSL